MSKRFTDSRKWDDPWFRKLPCKYKCFWMFILDKCNHAGIWKVDFEGANFHIKDDMNEIEIIEMFKDRIVVLNEKWFIPKFIEFQYQTAVNNLNVNNRVHKSVVDLLEKEGVCKPLASPLQGCKDKDKDKDKDEVVSFSKEIVNKKEFEELWNKYPNKDGKRKAYEHFKATVKTEKDFENIKVALGNYLKSERVLNGYIKNGSTWFNNWTDWISYKDEPKRKLSETEAYNLASMQRFDEKFGGDNE